MSNDYHLRNAATNLKIVRNCELSEALRTLGFDRKKMKSQEIQKNLAILERKPEKKFI